MIRRMMGMLHDLLRATPVHSIDEAVTVMTAIDQRLPDADGLKWFNRLYLRVTSGVRNAVAGPAFADPAFMTALDVVFANLYFAALTSADDGDFEGRRRPGVRCSPAVATGGSRGCSSHWPG